MERKNKNKSLLLKIIYSLLNYVKWFGLRKLYWTIRRYISPKNLTANYLSQRFVAEYDGYIGQNANYKKSFIGLGLIHYAYIRNIKPKNILCIGSRKGFIPAILALACKENGTGHVDFVDAGYGQENTGKHWTGIGFWKKVDSEKHFAHVGVNHYITAYVTTTKEYASKFPNKKFDYIYIDGDHSYEGVRYDYQKFWGRLNKGGFMAFHDIEVTGKQPEGIYGVKKLWKEISRKNYMEFPFTGSGLGIIQKT